MPKIAVMLSGCGVLDGSEIHEAVITLLSLDRAGATYQCLAPDMDQHQVTHHLTRENTKEKRNVLVEAARIARGDILDVAKANPDDYDGLIFPGGFGAATNLCDFAAKGAACEVQADVLSFAQKITHAGKPIGFICISPVMISKICGQGVKQTVGKEDSVSAAIREMGGQHEVCDVGGVVVDTSKRVVSTPAYMLANSIKEAAEGIEKLVDQVLSLTK